MENKQNMYDDRKAGSVRNEKRLLEIRELDNKISKVKVQYAALNQKHILLKNQYDAIKQSNVWELFIQMNKLKRFMKLCLKYITGKRSIIELFDPSIKKKNAKKKIKKLKYRLYELGLTEKALAELKKESIKSDNKYVRKFAAWELGLWYANQYSEEDAKKSIEFVNKAIKGEKDRSFLRKSAIVKAECYDILNRKKEAEFVISEALVSQKHADLYLARANLESSYTERIKWINKALELYDITPLEIKDAKNCSAYDCLCTVAQHEKKNDILWKETPKVTIIIPAFNAAKSIRTTLVSVISQTWKNIEVLVVDDCSTDHTIDIVKEYMNQDSRIKVISTKKNSGAYKARNEALKIAIGDFVTINDADDWSHPRKIEVQVLNLMENADVIANTSEQARVTEDLKFHRRGKPGVYIFSNMSSLMFRRKPVVEKLGFWDSVRFGADGEFKKRLKLVFGDSAVVDLKTGPYSFQRQSNTSLTGNHVFGYHGFFMGARKEYAESYNHYHKKSLSLYYPFSQEKRPYPVPEPMLPNRKVLQIERRHFDVIIASEFRLSGGTNMSNIEEIKAQKKFGLRTGLIQMYRYDLNSVKDINPKVRELVDGDQVQMLVYGEKVSCDVLIVRHPPILQEWQKYIPDIEARNVRVIINQPPKREYSETGETLYDMKRCVQHLEEYVGRKGKWYPIGPLIRDTLYKHHASDLKTINLAKEDWVNIINVEEWRRSIRPKNKKIHIGRHSRDQYVKWPQDRTQMLMIYPEKEIYEIQVLGGANAPTKVLGKLPDNWHVYGFGEINPKDFLKGLDVFVYYTHSDWVEAFGRVLIEAMAVGVPVIVPPTYKKLFGNAAIYAEPSQVEKEIQKLMNDEIFYQTQVQKAQHYVEQHFGYSKHALRLENCFLKNKLQFS
ncbi:glycosyltransferase [Heyndrickxia sporothermodurans]|uniref:glycosyltransferase n=1 Tax=Heyndrickxia sporothermodurans TaxID=46224 RepID=UPI002E2316BE|nr:glycosyltransferase [Heyndrickxia sporothermodurans]